MGYSDHSIIKILNAGWLALRRFLTQCDSILITVPSLIEAFGEIMTDYNRTPSDYDYALFTWLYTGNSSEEEYNPQRFPNLYIKKCMDGKLHMHNTTCLTPANLIFSLKLITLIRNKTLHSFLTEEVVNLKVKGVKGFIITNRRHISTLLFKFTQLVTHLVTSNVYLFLIKIYDEMTAKKMTWKYLQITNVMKINEHIASIQKEFIYNTSVQAQLISETTNYGNIENIEAYKKIVYHNFSELAMKWMDLLWIEWQNGQSLTAKRDHKKNIAFFKKSVDDAISNYDRFKERTEFNEFVQDFIQTHGQIVRKENAPSTILYQLKKSIIKESHRVDNEDMNVDAHEISKLDSKTIREESKHYTDFENESKTSEEDIIETARYFEARLTLEENELELDRTNIYNQWPNGFIWSQFTFYMDHILWFTLIFYHKVYKALDEKDVSLLKDLQFSNSDASQLNIELLDFWKKIDDLCESKIDYEDMKSYITKFNEQLTYHWFDQNYLFEVLLGCLSEEHPFFWIDAKMTHIWDRIKRKTLPFKSSKQKAVNVSKGYLEWIISDLDGDSINFTEYFMENEFTDHELFSKYQCCGSSKNTVTIDEYPRFMWMTVNINSLPRNRKVTWRFAPFVTPSIDHKERLELLAVMFETKMNYFCIIKLGIRADDKRNHWYIYNPTISEQLSSLPKENIHNSVLIIRSSDFDIQKHPCLLLYSKCS